MLKRYFVTLLTAVMVLAAMPLASFADTATTVNSGETTNKEQTTNTAPTSTQPVATPGNVKGFKALSTYNGVLLQWKKVNGADGYLISYKNGSTLNKITIKNKNTVEQYVNLPAALRNKKVSFSIVATKGKVRSAQITRVSGEAIRTQYWTITFNTTRKLTSHSGKKTTRTFKKGTKVDAYGYNGGRYIFSYKGETYYVMRVSITNAKIKYSNHNLKYTKKESEDFVNRKKLKSNTNYLIWVNTYTQKIYIFKKSGAKWKLVKGAWKVSTGLPRTPTRTGMTRIKQKAYSTTGFECKYWNVCTEFSIHGKASYYPAMGKPASNGCVRNETVNARWIYNNVPIGTAVYVF